MKIGRLNVTNPSWLDLAWRDVGIREVDGTPGNPDVMRYYKDVGADWVKDDDVAWCAAFAGSCLERAGLTSTRSLMARSYLKWGQKISRPRMGAVAVLRRGKNKNLGHVGFYVGENGRSVFLLGGNQSDSVSIGSYAKSRLLGYRWPGNAPAARIRSTIERFDHALEHVLEFEGGWTDDPQDPGGPTNKGITLQVYAESNGVKITRVNRKRLMRGLRRIDDDFVREIYLERYWKKARCPELHPSLAFIHFDAAVNHGPGRAVRMLQRAVGTEVDGEIGPLTLRAAHTGNVAQAVREYGRIRDRFYRSLSHFPRFGRGWLRRLRAAVSRALVLAGNHSIENRRKEKTTMTNEPKWWGQSMTIWGAIVTALTTVVPVVGPLLGYDISAEMVAQFGEQIARFIQVTGGIVGTIMTVFGRLRTSAPLERRKMSFDF